MRNLNEACDSFFVQFEGDTNFAVNVMYNDIDELKLNDKQVLKLLRLASCESSPAGEKLNAARAAFKKIRSYVELNRGSFA